MQYDGCRVCSCFPVVVLRDCILCALWCKMVDVSFVSFNPMIVKSTMWFLFFKQTWPEALLQLVFNLKLWNTDFPPPTPNILVYLKYKEKIVILKKTLLNCPVISGQFLYICVCVSVLSLFTWFALYLC